MFPLSRRIQNSIRGFDIVVTIWVLVDRVRDCWCFAPLTPASPPCSVHSLLLVYFALFSRMKSATRNMYLQKFNLWPITVTPLIILATFLLAFAGTTGAGSMAKVIVAQVICLHAGRVQPLQRLKIYHCIKTHCLTHGLISVTCWNIVSFCAASALHIEKRYEKPLTRHFWSGS